MKAIIKIAGSLLLFAIISCNNSETKSDEVKISSSGESKKGASEKFIEGKDYTEFVRARVMDKTGFTEPVEAMSLLIPKGWSFDGEIMWNPPGTNCAGNNKNIKAVSADGKFSFEMLPDHLWSYTSDPQLQQFSQGQATRYCSFGEPSDAEAYFKNVFVANDLNSAEVISITPNNNGTQVLNENNNKARQELMKYGASEVNFYPSSINAKVKWSDGSEGIVICAVNIIETLVPNIYNGTTTKSYTTVATERVVMKYPTGENAKAENLLGVMMGSIRTNNAWKNSVDNFWLSVRQQRNIAHIGKIRMMDEQTRQMGENAIRKGQENLNNMDANMRSWEAKQQSQDRMHTSFVKTIREVETYRDGNGTVELNSGYNHAWSRSDGSSFILSDNPNFDPSSVFQDSRWEEMKKTD